MSVTGLTVLDLVAAVAATVALLGAATAAVTGRARAAAAALAAGLAFTLARLGVVAALWPAGWWFVQDKVTLTLPLAAATAAAAVVMSLPRLLPAARTGRPAGGAAVVVPLFAAGYAAAAGPVVTLVGGYPVSWTAALLAVAVTGAATLLTWRAARPPVPRAGWLAAGTAALAVAAAGTALVPAAPVDAGGGPAAGHVHQARPVAELRGPREPAPGGTVRRYTLTARTATVTLASGRRVAAWTFDGRVPGPALTATEGDLVEVTLRNADIAAGVTLHWHGYDVPAGEDGVPGLTQEAVRPGGTFEYRFRADQAGTYWYHTHEVSDLGVRMGLYGMLVVAPRRAGPAGEENITLAAHTLGGALVLGDRDGPFDRRTAAGTPVRLRLVNTDSTPHRFTLAGTRFRVAAIDGRDLAGPGELERVALRLPAGGRYDVVFPMPAGGAVLGVDGRPSFLRLVAGAAPGPPEGTAGWPEFDPLAYGTPAPAPLPAAGPFDRRFTMVLDRGFAVSGGRPMYAHTVNGRAYPDVPAQLVGEGDLVRVTVVNRSLETHPWHLHGHTVQVLARDGRAPSGTPLLLDTFDVRPGEVWEVAFEAGNPGLWMNHCHNLAHADLGMMLHLVYAGVSGSFHGTHGG
ncbi:hypothetical protein Sru01_43470 [Sphaerisporangium rufum]|uniref:Copper-containing nitrite reductase n=1 Tax=Sphaerisporangium rufum TaxID=1381558 RepID=A0A919V6H5_9ACTN|nr:multicopper oxidase family protein [Sphaerisporangium rufum]GII79365.1 hypothetical protein Sru01_43470 [Sphaerisporangium rufum]